MKNEPIKIPKIIGYYIKTAFGDEDTALQSLIIASTGDDYSLKEDYNEWLRMNDVQIGITELGLEQITGWLSNQQPHELMGMVRNREVQE